MSANEPAVQESDAPSDSLPPAIGVDVDGLVHHVAAQFPRQAIITSDGETVVGRHSLSAYGLDSRAGWVAHVATELGWTDEWAGQRLTGPEIQAAIAAAQR
jgi:hypothetical protein